MKKYVKASLIAAVFSMLPLQHAFSAPVEQVKVQVVDQGGTSPLLLGKMAHSMEVVAQQLFLEQESSSLNKAKDQYAKVLGDVGDRVFTGYDIVAVDLSLGTATTVTMYTRPWKAVMKEPQVELVFSGVDPRRAALLKSHLGSLKESLQQLLEGAPQAAGDWAGGLVRRLVKQQLEESLPHFKAAVDLVQEGSKTTVQVIIYPVGSLVNNITYSMSSSTIPNLLLVDLKYKYQDYVQQLRGLPLDYVKDHREQLAAELEQQLRQEPLLDRYKLQPQVRLRADKNLQVEVLIDSSKYRLYLEGYGDIGRKRDNLSGRAHLGKLLSSKEELFLEADLALDNVHWSYGPGYSYTWGKTTLSYQRRFPEEANLYRAVYSLGPQWQLRAEHFSATDRNEFALGYRIHEFLRAEYVYGGRESYLRLIGNL